MSDDRLARLRVGDAERDEVLNLLQEAYISGRLEVDEYQVRQEKCMAARYREDLAQVVADLPEGRKWLGEERRPVVQSASRAAARVESAPDFVILAGKDIYLDASRPSFSSFAIMGGHKIHVAEPLAAGHVVKLDLSSVLGGFEVFVPEGVQVVDETTCVLGSVSVARKARGDGSGGTLVLTGFQLMGGVNIKLAR